MGVASNGALFFARRNQEKPTERPFRAPSSAEEEPGGAMAAVSDGFDYFRVNVNIPAFMNILGTIEFQNCLK